MKQVKIVAIVVLAVLVTGLLNSIAGCFKGPSIPGAGVLKGIETTTKPWREARDTDPMRKVRDKKPEDRGLLAAIGTCQKSDQVPPEMTRLIEQYRKQHEEEYDNNPWHLFYESLARLIMSDTETFDSLSSRLFAMESITGDLLAFMGSQLDKYGFHDDAWRYYERSIRQYAREGASMDESGVLIFNQFFYPLTRLKKLTTEGKTDVVMQRLNALVKMNPRVEGMYWIYMQLARYFEKESRADIARVFTGLAAKQFRFPVLFSPWLMVYGDYYLNAMVIILLMFPVYIAALRLKYRAFGRHARTHSRAGTETRRRWTFSWKHSPNYYIKPGECVFLLILAGLCIVTIVNECALVASIGRGASTPINFGLGRHAAPESRKAMDRLKTDYGELPEFKRFNAYSLALSGEFAASRAVLQQILQKSSDDVPSLVNLAVIEHREGNELQAERLIRRAVVLAPGCLEALHNHRIITGENTVFPQWFQTLLTSRDLGVTAKIVLEHFDSIWPNAMAVVPRGGSGTLFLSDRGLFFARWTEEPRTLQARVIGALELTGLLASEDLVGNPLSMMEKEFSSLILYQVLFVLLVGYFCVMFIKAAGDPQRKHLTRCRTCGAVVCGLCKAASPDADTECGSLCDSCARDAQYDDESFLAGKPPGSLLRYIPFVGTYFADKPQRSLLRYIPFVGTYLTGNVVAGTVSLLLFLYCFVAFVFTNSSVLGVYGASGILASIAVPNVTVTPLAMTLSVHYAGTHTVLLVAGMAVSILISLAASVRQTD